MFFAKIGKIFFCIFKEGINFAKIILQPISHVLKMLEQDHPMLFSENEMRR